MFVAYDPGADLAEPVLPAGLHERGLHVRPVLPRAEELHPGRAGHPVVQGAHLPTRDREPPHVEELDLGQRPSVRGRQYVEGSRALHLVAVELPPPRRVHGRPLVALHRHVVAAGLRVVLHPVVGGGTSNEAHAVFVQEEEDPVADHVAVVVAGHELLGLVHGEVLEGVHAERREQPDHVGALDVEVGHVVRLVEKGRGLAPGDLLVSPVRELARHRRVDVRSDLRVTGQLDGATDCVKQVLEALHLRSSSRQGKAARSGRDAPSLFPVTPSHEPRDRLRRARISWSWVTSGVTHERASGRVSPAARTRGRRRAGSGWEPRARRRRRRGQARRSRRREGRSPARRQNGYGWLPL